MAEELLSCERPTNPDPLAKNGPISQHARWQKTRATVAIPMSKREEGILSRADFTFDRQRDLYICPQGNFLRTTGNNNDRPGTLIILRIGSEAK